MPWYLEPLYRSRSLRAACAVSFAFHEFADMQFQKLNPVATISQSGSFACKLQTQLALLTWRQLAVTLHLPASSEGSRQ